MNAKNGTETLFATLTPTLPSPAGAPGSERALNGLPPVAQPSSRTTTMSQPCPPEMLVRQAENAI